MHYDDTKKRAPDSQIVRGKENLQLSYGGPSQGQASGTNQRIKALCRGRHCLSFEASRLLIIFANRTEIRSN